MTTIYTILKDLFQIKSGKLDQSLDYDEAVKSNYLLQRWISMESSNSSIIVNEITNKLWIGLEDDKKLWYKLLNTILYKKNFGKIKYIKKSDKKTDENIEKVIECLANRNELSKREIEEYLELSKTLNIDTERYNKLT